MKVFLSVSYTSKVDTAKNILSDYRDELEAIIAIFESRNHLVYCAPREDKWTLTDTTPAEAFNSDMQSVEKSDVLIAFIRTRVSAGIQMEIGYAFAKGKQIILALPTEDILGYVNQGLVEAGGAKLLRYQGQADLLTELERLAEAF